MTKQWINSINSSLSNEKCLPRLHDTNLAHVLFCVAVGKTKTEVVDSAVSLLLFYFSFSGTDTVRSICSCACLFFGCIFSCSFCNVRKWIDCVFCVGYFGSSYFWNHQNFVYIHDFSFSFQYYSFRDCYFFLFLCCDSFFSGGDKKPLRESFAQIVLVVDEMIDEGFVCSAFHFPVSLISIYVLLFSFFHFFFLGDCCLVTEWFSSLNLLPLFVQFRMLLALMIFLSHNKHYQKR